MGFELLPLLEHFTQFEGEAARQQAAATAAPVAAGVTQ